MEQWLCDECQQFDIQRLSQHTYPGKALDVDNVRHGVEAGYHFCTLLMEHVKDTLNEAESKSSLLKSKLWIHLSVLDSSRRQRHLNGETARLGINRLFARIAPRFWSALSETWPIEVSLVTGREMCLAADPGTLSLFHS
jgi:hypothetical protein